MASAEPIARVSAFYLEVSSLSPITGVRSFWINSDKYCIQKVQRNWQEYICAGQDFCMNLYVGIARRFTTIIWTFVSFYSGYLFSTYIVTLQKCTSSMSHLCYSKRNSKLLCLLLAALCKNYFYEPSIRKFCLILVSSSSSFFYTTCNNFVEVFLETLI